jgi:hypothetical protein
MSTRIVHISDARGTDVRRFLDPAAHVVDLIRIGVNLADIDWDKAKKFTKKSYAERVVLDVGAHGESIDVQFLMGTPRLVKATLEMRRESPDSVGMIIMRPGIVGGPPKGHLVNYSEIVFDDEADVTLGSLVLQCHTPEGPLQGIPPGTEGVRRLWHGGRACEKDCRVRAHVKPSEEACPSGRAVPDPEEDAERRTRTGPKWRIFAKFSTGAPIFRRSSYT